MTTPVREPEAAPAREPETTPEEPETISQEMFDGPVPENTVWVRWHTAGGPRTMNLPLNLSYLLTDAPTMYGIEIKSEFKVVVLGWRNSWPNDPPILVVNGPTEGRVSIEPSRMVGMCRVERK